MHVVFNGFTKLSKAMGGYFFNYIKEILNQKSWLIRFNVWQTSYNEMNNPIIVFLPNANKCYRYKCGPLLHLGVSGKTVRSSALLLNPLHLTSVSSSSKTITSQLGSARQAVKRWNKNQINNKTTFVMINLLLENLKWTVVSLNA